MSNPITALAMALLQTAELHEESFNSSTGTYNIPIADAAIQVCEGDDSITYPITTLLTMDWNGALEWAQENVLRAEVERRQAEAAAVANAPIIVTDENGDVVIAFLI